MSARPVTDDDLHAYVDGCLSPGRQREVEAWLSEDPAAAQKVRAYREQAAALRRRFDAILDEPIPQRLLDILRQQKSD